MYIFVQNYISIAIPRMCSFVFPVGIGIHNKILININLLCVYSSELHFSKKPQLYSGAFYVNN